MRHSFRSQRQGGAVLLYALIILLVGTTLMAAWASFMGSRVLYTDIVKADIQRRIVLDNSRSLATQHFLANVLPAEMVAGTNALDVDIVESGVRWARFSYSYPAPEQIMPLATTSTSSATLDSQGQVNQFSPGGGAGFEINITTSLYFDSGNTSTSWEPWLFLLKSRNLMFAHDQFTANLPSGSLVAGIGNAVNIAQNSLLWTTGAYSIDTATYQASTISTTLSSGGSPLLPLNFAFIPLSDGLTTYDYPVAFANRASVGIGGGLDVVGGALRTSGIPLQLSLLYRAGWLPVTGRQTGTGFSMYRASDFTLPPTIDLTPTSPAPPPPAINLISTNGAGEVTINLMTTETKVFIWGSTSKITLVGATGTAADDMSALLIVLYEPVGTPVPLAEIELSGANDRRVYLAVRKETASGAALDLTPVTGPFRLAGVFENASLTCTVPGAATLVGGLRSNAGITVTGGNLSVLRELSAGTLDFIANRTGWLESYRQ